MVQETGHIHDAGQLSGNILDTGKLSGNIHDTGKQKTFMIQDNRKHS